MDRVVVKQQIVSRKIYKAIIQDDWDSVSDIFKEDKGRLNAPISSDGMTPLYIAVGTNCSHRFAEKLVEQIMSVGVGGGVEMLRTQNSHKMYNALHESARRGNTRDAKLLVRNDPDMPHTVNGIGNGEIIPLDLAAWYGHEETVRFLLSVTRDQPLIGGDATSSPFRGIPGATILGEIINAGLYDIALYLVQKYPHLVAERNDTGETALVVLAAQGDAFPSGTKLNFVERVLYSQIDAKSCQQMLKYPTIGNGLGQTAIEMVDSAIRGSRNSFRRYFHKAAYIKRIRNIKARHVQAGQLLKEILSVLLNLEDDINLPILGNGIQTAVAHGSYELVEECVRNHPMIIWYPVRKVQSEEKLPNLFWAAIENRQEKVFNLIHQISAHKTNVLASVVGENGLHLVGKLAPYHRLGTVTGVALQMQRELLWFKEVEKFMVPGQREYRNNENKTPRMVFSDEHKHLLIDAQQWTKDTSSSSTVVAALIITITFAAMFTVPGGNNDYGKSIYLRDPVFLLFVISDAIALFSSSTSVLMFLSTLTHSSQEDFLYALPLRLTLGLISLFISLATTMIAFSATLVLVLRDEIQWIVAPVTLLASVPVILFLWLQYPLLQELVYATFGKSIFQKQSNELLH